MLTIMSFGFKYGLPTDADMVADMRFLPNPYWDPSLRAFTGQDPQVRDYVLETASGSGFVDRFDDLVGSLDCELMCRRPRGEEFVAHRHLPHGPTVVLRCRPGRGRRP